MSRSFSFLPAANAAVNQRGRLPRPDQVSAGFAGLRYFGAALRRVRFLRPRPNSSSMVYPFDFAKARTSSRAFSTTSASNSRVRISARRISSSSCFLLSFFRSMAIGISGYGDFRKQKNSIIAGFLQKRFGAVRRGCREVAAPCAKRTVRIAWVCWRRPRRSSRRARDAMFAAARPLRAARARTNVGGPSRARRKPPLPAAGESGGTRGGLARRTRTGSAEAQGVGRGGRKAQGRARGDLPHPARARHERPVRVSEQARRQPQGAAAEEADPLQPGRVRRGRRLRRARIRAQGESAAGLARDRAELS